MSEANVALTALLCLLLAVHLLSSALTLWRVRRPKRTVLAGRSSQPVSVMRPVCGLDGNDEATLASTFRLAAHPNLDIVFCAARESDPAVPLLRRLIAQHPHVRARLLIGDERPTANPKLNNLVKGWSATSGTWVVMADSNVLLPADAVADLMGHFRSDTGLVCSPPIGSAPSGFAAELECAFLNTYQGRFQLAADTLGFGFAQGKTMFWRRDLLEAAGGLEALGREAAEDAAATKIVRAEGRRVRLVDRPYPQPLGRRRLADVWRRQVRWARLRRTSFPLCYAPEIFASAAIPVAVAALLASTAGSDPLAAAGAVAAVWYATEAAVARAAGWHVSVWSPAAFLVRDLMLPLIWIEGLTGNDFTWRGNEMSASLAVPQARPGNG